MKTLQVLEPEKLTPEEVKALRAIGFDVKPPCVGVLGFENITTWPVVGYPVGVATKWERHDA